MNYYKERAKILNKINQSLKSVPQNQINLTETNVKPINIVNQNVTDYNFEASNLLGDFIQNQEYSYKIIDDLYQDNDLYPKELVLHWDIYKTLLNKFRGSNVSLSKIYDTLLDALKENVNKKQEITINNTSNKNEFINFFFNDNKLFKSDLPDSKKKIKSILAYIIRIHPDDRDKVFYEKISNILNGDEIRNINEYITTIVDKDKFIERILRDLPIPIYTKLFNMLITNTNLELEKEMPPAKEKDLISDELFLNLKSIDNYLINTNSYFIYALFVHINDNVIGIEDENNLTIKEQEITKNKKELIDEIKRKQEEKRKAEEKKRQEEKDKELKQEENEQNNMFAEEINKKSIDKQESEGIKNFDNGIEPYIKKFQNIISNFSGNNFLKVNDKLKDINENFEVSEYQTKLLKKSNQSNNKKEERKKLLKDFNDALIKKYFEDKNKNIFSLIKKNTKIDYNEKLRLFRVYFNVFDELIINKGEQKDINNLLTTTGGGLVHNNVVFMGKGIQSHKQKLADKYYVNRRLLNQGILDIRYLKNGHKTHIQNSSMMSNNAKDVLNDMFDDKKLDSDKFVKLNNFEKDLIRQVNNHYLNSKYKLNDDDDDLFNKNYQILVGEWRSGNNNIMIRKQIMAYLDHAVDLGKITHHEKRKIEHSLFFNH